MKKLMFAAAAIAAGIAVADVTSANIVGYKNVATDGSKAAAAGSVFFPVVPNADGEYDLRTIVVKGVDSETFVEPSGECIKKFEFGSTVVEARYTYISAEWLDAAFEDETAHTTYAWAIGWWNYVVDHEYAEDIDAGKNDLMIKEPIMVKVGTAFLGSFDAGKELIFTTSGAVADGVTAFENKGSKAPYFLNYLPVDIKLQNISVDGNGDADTFMEPSGECLKKFEFGSTVVEARYTYISAEWLDAAFEDETAHETYAWAIGWWNYVADYEYAEDIDAGKSDLMLKSAVDFPSGHAFLGSIDAGKMLRFKFPDPLNVPAID